VSVGYMAMHNHHARGVRSFRTLWECFEQQQPWRELSPMQIIYSVGLQVSTHSGCQTGSSDGAIQLDRAPCSCGTVPRCATPWHVRDSAAVRYNAHVESLCGNSITLQG